MATYKVATDKLDGYQIGDTFNDKDADARQVAKLLASGAIVKQTTPKKTETTEE